MTDVLDRPVETPETAAEAKARKDRERDFSKASEMHQELADFVNAAGVGVTVDALQVKAILLLRSDFNDRPERKAERDKRKAEKAEREKRFEGLTPEQKEIEKAAQKAEDAASRAQARVDEALAKAKALREGKVLDGADLASAVEDAQGEKKITRRK